MTAKVDATELSTVVWCPVCPWFSTITVDESHGHDLAVAHDRTSHPENTVATMNRWNFHRRISAQHRQTARSL
jgi:hypothetical protein